MEINLAYLMGGSFVLGSMCTLFALMMLDFINRGKNNENDDAAE